MSKRVLLVGGTGMLGGKIARELQDGSTTLRLLVRPGKAEQAQGIGLMVEVVEGNLTDSASLARATEDCDVIVSAVQGGPDIIVDGQIALAHAGRENGVTRMLPSDFALDIFKAVPGEHPMFDQRVEADFHIAEMGIEVVNVLQGAFMMMVVNGFSMMPGAEAVGLPFIDHNRRIARYWGTGDERVEATSMRDTARITATVALSDEVMSGRYSFYGEKVSFNQAIDISEDVTRSKYDRASLGTEAQLRARMDAASGQARLMLPYALYMLNGQTALTDVQNVRPTRPHCESLDTYIRRTLPVEDTRIRT